MKPIKFLKTLWDDNIRIIDNQEKLEEYKKEIRDRVILQDDNLLIMPTTISFGDWDWHNLDPYNWQKEYIKIVKRDNHETIHRIPYE